MVRKLEELLEKAYKFYQNYQYNDALEIIALLPKVDKKQFTARSLKAAILIERWDGNIYDRKEIFEAIDHLKIVLGKDPNNKKTYLYNLGNAYLKLAVFDRGQNYKKLNLEIVKNLENAKKYFEESLFIDGNQPEVWINLGNTFNYLGRYLEGIECYDNAIMRDSTHYNAWAARGTCCWDLSQYVTNKQDKKMLFRHAMDFLRMDFKFNPNVPRNTETKRIVDEFFERNKPELNPDEILKKIMPIKRESFDEKFNLYGESTQDFQIFYQTFCAKYGLFLNVHFDCLDCVCKNQDLIEFRFVLQLNKHEKTYELMKKWFGIRDDYKTARALLAYAQYRSKDMLFLDKQRYEPDYSLNYLFNVELLKNSFVSLMNIYDKVALLLNEYEDLGLRESSVSFWGKHNIFTKTTILEKNYWNLHLVAMDSIRRDLEGNRSKNNSYKKMIDIRNYIVHRYFILHDIVDSKNLTYPYDAANTPIRNPEYHMDIHEFFILTIKAMRSIRNILFSLSFYVGGKENKKIKNSNEFIPKIAWTTDWDENPELKKLADETTEKIAETHQKCLHDILDALKKDGTMKDR